jgi:hypothetical protein
MKKHTAFLLLLILVVILNQVNSFNRDNDYEEDNDSNLENEFSVWKRNFLIQKRNKMVSDLMKCLKWGCNEWNPYYRKCEKFCNKFIQ